MYSAFSFYYHAVRLHLSPQYQSSMALVLTYHRSNKVRLLYHRSLLYWKTVLMHS